MAASIDPLGVAKNLIEVSVLKTWHESIVPSYPDIQPSKQSPFQYCSNINQKLVLWTGDITTLKVDAIVNPTNENLSVMSPINQKIFEIAGPSLHRDIRDEIGKCATGESKLSKGYNLPSRYVIHTVGPKYNPRYLSAVENALYRSYRSSLLIAGEYKVRSIAIPTVHLHQRGFPVSEGAHIALRTVRRYLEHQSCTLETVIFILDDTEMEIYKRLAVLYFPRSNEEEAYAFENLPEDIGNEFGEPTIKERSIRIQDKIVNSEDEKTFTKSDSAAFRAFSKMAGDHDIARSELIQSKSKKTSQLQQNAKRYQTWLKLARTLDTKDIIKLKALYKSGVDQYGRSVIVFIGNNFPAHLTDLNKAISYYAYLMDDMVDNDYIAIYFHTLTNAEQRPPANFLKLVYQTLDPKYHKNLKAFYVVHPSWWLKWSFWSFCTFTAPELKSKLQYIDDLKDLLKFIPRDQFSIPQYLFDENRKMNGNSVTTPNAASQPDEL
ncbi:Protein GDAP2-like protein [Trichoplax sp. H2]|nr:Protein GDAP2-like protein [Trichoplax sp. H2]|eukprot:RDD45903.1 Protein GDAP2-like protein [Trichoplax sp. H2]